MSTPTTFTVYRKTWYRGHGTADSRLLREDGMRCCLGHVGKQCGLRDAELLGVISPRGNAAFPTFLIDGEAFRGNSKTCSDMMEINDDRSISDTEREAKLTEIAAANGITLIFTDEEEPQP